MLHVKQAIVVEGRYDRNTLRQLVDATIFETNGFAIFHDKEKLTLLRRVAAARGLIILTDSDGAGFVIRNFLKGALPQEGVLHAYVPDLYGKEKRKRQPGKEGKLGVEGMRPAILLEALRRAGAELDGEAKPNREEITRLDFFEAGLSGRPDSAACRRALTAQLDLPEHMSTSALLDALNALLGRMEFLEMMKKL